MLAIVSGTPRALQLSLAQGRSRWFDCLCGAFSRPIQKAKVVTHVKKAPRMHQVFLLETGMAHEEELPAATSPRSSSSSV